MLHNRRQAIVVGIIVLVIALMLYKMGATRYLGLEFIQAKAIGFKAFTQRHCIISVLLYITVVAACGAFALPIFAPAAIVAGYLFGVVMGTFYAVVALTSGAALSFLIARYLSSNLLQERYGARLSHFKQRVNEHGSIYLIMLQLLAVIPYVVINSLAALAQVPFFTFVWTSAVGTLPMIIVYALAGKQLGTLSSVSDIVSFKMIAVLVILALLSLLPMLIKKKHNNTKKPGDHA